MSPVLGKAASCGDNIIKVHDLSDMREVYDVVTLEEERSLDKLELCLSFFVFRCVLVSLYEAVSVGWSCKPLNRKI